MATKAAKDSVEPLKYKTWTLKVPIHCEGCKKKVKKILQGIDGVYTTTVDSLHHKVTVTGDVDGETLVKKILKSGKYAELILPEIAKKDEKKTGKQKNNEKKKDAEGGKNDNDEQKNLTEDPGSADKIAGGDNTQDASENGQPLSNGGEKKKSKTKGQKPNPSNGGGNDHTGEAQSNNEVQPVNPINLSLPQQQMYPYPPLYYPNPTLLYGITYSSANPISNGTSHFAPPMHPHSYSYTGRYLPPPPSDPAYDNYSDSDESGCYIM